jgi:hypothetical protein
MSVADLPADDYVPVRRRDVEWVELDAEAVLDDPSADTLHRLNAGAAAVWAACDGSASVARIVAAVRRTYSGSPIAIDRDVRTVIARLRRLGLLQKPPGDVGTAGRGDGAPRPAPRPRYPPPPVPER